MTAATILFWDLPEGLWREVVTGRIKRYKKKYENQVYLNRLERWRLWWSDLFGNFANKYDAGHY